MSVLGHPITDVRTFWQHAHTITRTLLRPPSDASCDRFNIRLFRAHIDPLWEDVSNIEGGRWSISIRGDGETEQQETQQTQQTQHTARDWSAIIQLWEQVMLAVIGETMPAHSYLVTPQAGVRACVIHVCC